MNLKHILSFLLLLCIMAGSNNFLKAQTYPSEQYYPNGKAFTPKGHMHCLVIFVTYGNTDQATGNFIGTFSDDKHPLYSTDPFYTTTPLPAWADGNGLITNNLNDVSITGNNLSSYYRTMSFGEFDLTGQVVSIGSEGKTSNADFVAAGLALINKSNFDKRTCGGSWSTDDSNSGTNGLVDYIVVVRKTLGGGDAAVPLIGAEEFGQYHDVKNDQGSLMRSFVHEFAHNMYDASHTCGANGVFHPHFNMQEGWGMLSNAPSPFFTARANEMWVNGWLREGQDVIEVNPGNVDTDSIELGDLLSTREAIRVEIPNSNPDPNGVNHYLWIEKHQKDHSSGFDNDPSGLENYDSGFYMYVTSKLNDLTSPFGTLSAGNNVHTLHPYGKKDYTLNAGRNGFIEGEDNPIAGLPVESYVRMNDPSHSSNTPNKIFHCTDQNDGKCNNKKSEHPGDFIRNPDGGPSGYRVTNNFRHAFQSGDILSINDIYPVLNYPEYNAASDVQEPFNLSGLKVEISNNNSILVSYDDWTFESNKRWCGTINLPGTETLTLTNSSNLDLDLSGTANKSNWAKNRGENVIQNFVTPTILTAKPGSTLVIENNSCLNAKKESTLQIDNGATLHLKTGGFIHVKDEDSKLVLNSGSTLILENDAFIEVKDGGTLEINTDDINLNNVNAKIIIEAGGILTSNSKSFNFDGLGQLVIKEGAIIDMKFNLTGQGPGNQGTGHTAILLEEGAHINMAKNFYLTDCVVAYEPTATITIADSHVKFDNVLFEPTSNAMGTSTAFNGNQLRSFNCKDSDFRDFKNGINLINYWVVTSSNPCGSPTQPTFKVENSNFENIQFEAISCTDIYKLYAIDNSFTNDVKSTITQNKAFYGDNCYFELVNNSIEKYFFGVYFYGGFSNSYKTLNLSSGNINNCNTGIFTKYSNSFIKYCANINNNDIGIHSMAFNQQSQKKLTIGRQGGAVVTNNTFAIKGENMLIEIDAISAKSANDGIHHPNDLSGNQVFFDLSYPNSNIPSGLSAKGNYWGWHNGCGGNIDDFSPTTNIPGFPNSYAAPFIIDDASKVDYPPVACLLSGSLCSGATAPVNNGNTATVSTNFNLIYKIANDYLEEESYQNALFGYSVLADVEEAPVYNSLTLSDQNTVGFSKVQQQDVLDFIEEYDLEECQRGEDPSLQFPDLEIVENTIDEVKLIKTVSPNPFKDAIQLVTSIDGPYLIEIFLANNLNGRALRQFKSNSAKYKIDASRLKSGVYILKVTDKEGRSDFAEVLKTY